MAKFRPPREPLLNDDSLKGEFKVPFYYKDFSNIVGYAYRIQKMVDRGDKVPARVLAKWFSFFEQPELASLSKRRILLEGKRKHVTSKLIPRYDFNIYVRAKSLKAVTTNDFSIVHQLPEKKGITSITLTYILQQFFESLAAESKFNDITINKNKFVKYAYKFLWSYLKLLSTRKQPTFYSQTIIIGYLAVEFNLLDDEEAFALNKTTNTRHYTEFLHEKTNYICKKVNGLLSPKL